MKKMLFSIVCLIGFAFMASSMITKPPKHPVKKKVTICHCAGKTVVKKKFKCKNYVPIQVSREAYDAHIQHGDHRRGKLCSIIHPK